VHLPGHPHWFSLAPSSDMGAVIATTTTPMPLARGRYRAGIATRSVGMGVCDTMRCLTVRNSVSRAAVGLNRVLFSLDGIRGQIA
jgi:hypothetical protein